MNILIPHSWLKEYLETQASPKKIGECLSLCGASVEKINQINGDKVYDIEVTTNRVDMMSVLGIAREAAAILPQFGIKASLKNDPYDKKLKMKSEKLKIETQKSNKLKVIIKDSRLCPRFTAIVLDNIKLEPSPKIIQERLKKAGMRPINNIVDITNYLMRELGQPYHVFDWAQIKKQTMILRESKKGEKITTLDGQTHKLPGGDIIIEDGDGRIIDLCGIMGGSNSHVSNKTQSILLFVQTYNPTRIRKTSMSLGKRSEAAAIFEKSPDPEMVLPALCRGIELIKKYAHGNIKSKIIDIYPHPYKSKKVNLSLQLIKQYLDLPIQLNEVKQILQLLGFKIKLDARRLTLDAEIPSWRAQDITISEDLIEEIARIYGYHNLPSVLPPLKQLPPKPNYNFSWEEKIKQTLKNWGLTETYTYSMQSKKEIEHFDFKPKKHLKIKNPLSSEWLYMRTNLLPSLLSVVKQNQNLDQVKIFEISNIYQPKKNALPDERLKLAIVFNNQNFYQLKGIIEALLKELTIIPIFKLPYQPPHQWQEDKSIIIQTKREGKIIKLGIIGQLKNKITKNFELKKEINAAYLDFDQKIKLAGKIKKYHPLPKYPPIIEDLTFSLEPKVSYYKLSNLIASINSLVKKVQLIDSYKNNLTFRIYYQDSKRNLTDKEVSKIRKAIIIKVQAKGWAKLRGKIKGLDLD